MDNDPSTPRHPFANPKDGGQAFAHLFVGDFSGPTPAWQEREAARRKGRGRKDWWKDCPMSASVSEKS